MKNKNFILSVLCLMFLTNFIYAQDVLLKQKQSVSGFISIESMLANYDGRIAYNQSANAAILLNQRFYIGGFSEVMLASQSRGFINDLDCYEPDFGSAGLMIGSIIKPEKLVHFDLRAKIGFGALRIREDNPSVIFGHDFSSDYEGVFVAQPSAGIEINITRFFKLNTHVGYRYVGGIDDPTYGANDLNGLTGQIGLVFGWFGQKKSKERELEENMKNL